MTQDQALEELRQLCPPGTLISTILRHVTRTGMTRCISAAVIYDGDLYLLDWLIDQAGVFKLSDKHGGLIVRGCGMDIGYHFTTVLGHRLYPDRIHGLKHRWL